MSRRPPLVILAVAAAALAGAPAALARDPGRWIRVAVHDIPIVYYQGITHDSAGHLFFDGIEEGGYRTDLALHQQAANNVLIPPTEPFNHIGDWTYDRSGGGRLILPMECYTPGSPNGGNTCGMGAFGVADPVTMTWRYRVLLDTRDIAKAMWAEVSPDGRLIWTSSGSDLLAYATADVSAANASGPPIRPVRRLAGAVPPSGVTGATFVGSRLLLAGQDTGAFEVWSIDLKTGKRRLEIDQPWAGESEGLDLVDALGGQLQWQVQPLDPHGRTPTFGTGHGALVTFVSRADARLRLSARPAPLPAGRRTRVRIRAFLRFARRDHPESGVLVSLAGRRARTNARGVATLTVRPARAGTLTAHAVRRPLLSGRLRLRVR